MSGFQNKVVFSEGSKITPTSSGSRTDLQQTSTDVARINYTGNPEGVISANPSSLCHDPVSGTVYKKDSGTGNTGWSSMTGITPGMVLIQTQTVTNVATIDFTTGFGSYTKLFISYHIAPVTNGRSLGVQQSVDGGSTWAGNFTWGLNYFPVDSATFTNVWNNASTPMQITDTAFDWANYQANGFIYIRNFQENYSLAVTHDGNFVYQPTTTWSRVLGLGQGLPNVNALRFLASAGNITGSISVYGLAS